MGQPAQVVDADGGGAVPSTAPAGGILSAVNDVQDTPRAPHGMPPSGPGSLAPLGRRLGAVVVDWLLCELIAVGLFQADLSTGGADSFIPLAVFAVENLLLVATLGFTVGHRLFGLQVRRTGPGVFAVQVAVRTVLLCLFVPVLIVGRDGRGLHDRAAGTVIVRR